MVCFYYAPGQFTEKEKKSKNDQGKKAEEAEAKETMKKSSSVAKLVSSQKDGTEVRRKVTMKKDAGSGKNIRVLEETMGKELPSSKGDEKEKGKAKASDPKVLKDKGTRFVPDWNVMTKFRLSNAKEFKDYLTKSCPPSESSSLSKYGLSDLEGHWLRKKCEAWFADVELFQRYNRIKDKVEREIVSRKALESELEEVKSSKVAIEEELEGEKRKVVALQEELEKFKKVADGWERKYWEEHARRAKWEESAKFLKNKYKDEDENINTCTFNFCKEAFLKSEECQNLVNRINLGTIRDAFKQASSCILKKHPDFVFPKDFQVYFDEEFNKSYVIPWEDNCDLDLLLRKFPTLDNSDEEGEPEEDMIMVQGDDGRNVIRPAEDGGSVQGIVPEESVGNLPMEGVETMEGGERGTMDVDPSSGN